MEPKVSDAVRGQQWHKEKENENVTLQNVCDSEEQYQMDIQNKAQALRDDSPAELPSPQTKTESG